MSIAKINLLISQVNSQPILFKLWILHISTNPTTSNIQISTNSNAYISVNSLYILVKFWILDLMTNPSKVFDTELNLNHPNLNHL